MKKISEYKKKKLLILANKYSQESYGNLAKMCGVSKSFAYNYLKNNSSLNR